jgi:hypothetical protein
LAPTHAPASQPSVCVHAFPSLHGVPSAFDGFEQVPVAGSQVPAVWHWSRALQETGFVPVQTPASQVSVCVQPLPSSQAAPFDLAGLEQVPVAGSQVPAMWHWSWALQETGFVPVQTPAWHVSLCVQALASSQVAPFDLAGLEQVPVAGSQVPATWHWSCALQVIGLLPVQTPASHVSLCVQALPSSQAAPFDLAGLEQVPVAGSQVPAVWHWSCALHVTGLLPVQTPA